MYVMPDTMGHDGQGINCMAMVDDQIYTGGRDGVLFAWRGQQGASGDFQLVQDSRVQMSSSVSSIFYEPSSRWLFCGLWDGSIHAFCKEPQMQEILKGGHRRSITSLIVHSGVVVSGSHEGIVRLWTRNEQMRQFQMHGNPLTNPSGPVSALRVVGDGLWVGGQTGITCFDLNTLQPRGTLQSAHAVTGMVELDGHMIATYANGDIKIFDAAGGEKYVHLSRGEHTTNTSVAMMTHPIENKKMLLCGQRYGYTTAYDLPDFRPRGSWCCKNGSDIRGIVDVQSAGMFVTAGSHSDVFVWKWGAQPQQAAGPSFSPVVANPFAPATQVPFAAAAQPCGGCMGAPGTAPCGGFFGAGGDMMG